MLHRIRAVRNFILTDGTKVHAGDFGWCVETEDNLSHGDKAWIRDECSIHFFEGEECPTSMY